LEAHRDYPAFDHSPLIELWLPDRAELRELLHGGRLFRGLQLAEGALPPRNWLNQTRYLSGLTERGYRWSVPYLIALPKAGYVVGSIGGKGIVDAESEVEIGYNVAPDFRNRKVATRAIQELAAVAAREDITLLAHTLPGNEPSRRALTAAGFLFEEMLRLADRLELERWTKLPD
jgi:RimJ/RimL family protein N-acetyltransferase